MRFFLDENMPLAAVEAFRGLGFEAEHARTVGLQGSSDQQIAAHVGRKAAVLVTKDLEFGSLLRYPRGTFDGVLVLRLPHYYTARQIIAALERFLAEVRPERLIGVITVLEEGKYRIRRLADS